MNGAPYEIERTTGRCAATDRELTPGRRRVTVLIERAGEPRLGRLDYAIEAWEAGARPPAGASVFGFWRNTVPEPGASAQPEIDAEGLMDLFEQLEDAAEPSRVALLYLVTLLLVRKKQLVVLGTSRDEGGGPMMLVRPRGDQGPPIRVAEPAIGPAQLAEIAAQLGHLVGLEG